MIRATNIKFPHSGDNIEQSQETYLHWNFKESLLLRFDFVILII